MFGFGLAPHPASQEELAEFIMGDIRGPAIPDHLAETQDHRAMRDLHRLLGVLLDEQDGLSTGIDAQELVEDDCNGCGRKTDRRFVDEQDLWPLQDGHRYFQQLLLAA